LIINLNIKNTYYLAQTLPVRYWEGLVNRKGEEDEIANLFFLKMRIPLVCWNFIRIYGPQERLVFYANFRIGIFPFRIPM